MLQPDEYRIAATLGEAGAGSMSAAERRRFFRIKDEVALKYQVISEQAYSAARDDVATSPPGLMSLANTFAATTRQMAPTVRRIRELYPDLCRYLSMVNEKLDMLARALSLAENEMATCPTQNICLSAGGIAFDAATPLPTGTRLKLTLVLFPSLIHIMGLAIVVRGRSRCEGASKQRVAVEFTDISDEDRELIIQHIVHRESRRLRARRRDAGQESTIDPGVKP